MLPRLDQAVTVIRSVSCFQSMAAVNSRKILLNVETKKNMHVVESPSSPNTLKKPKKKPKLISRNKVSFWNYKQLAT